MQVALVQTPANKQSHTSQHSSLITLEDVVTAREAQPDVLA